MMRRVGNPKNCMDWYWFGEINCVFKFNGSKFVVGNDGLLKFGIKLNPNVPFDHYINVFGRFDQNEKPFKIFEYEEETPFGKGKNMEKIIEEYQTVQSFLRTNGYNDY